MTSPTAAPLDLAGILRAARTIAVVGCSDSPYTTSYRIAGYLLGAGFEVIPVNPNHTSVLGRTCFPSVEAIPYTTQLDVVNIFRQPRYTAEMVQHVLRRIADTGERPVIWTQIGVHSAEAERLSVEAGLPYVRNRCIMVEHVR